MFANPDTVWSTVAAWPIFAQLQIAYTAMPEAAVSNAILVTRSAAPNVWPILAQSQTANSANQAQFTVILVLQG